MGRHAVEIRADLARLGADPSEAYQRERAELEQELRDAETEQAAQVMDYWALRRAIEADIATYEAMCAQIDAALEPVLAMMAQSVVVWERLDDDMERLKYLGPDAKVFQGPPLRTARVWGEVVATRLRERRGRP